MLIPRMRSNSAIRQFPSSTVRMDVPPASSVWSDLRFLPAILSCIATKIIGKRALETL